MKKLFLTLMVLAAAAPFISADTSNSLSGREIVELGKTVKISGILSEKENEWYINSGSTEYAVHLGNEDYGDSINLNLSEGDKAEINGFIHGSDIAVCTIRTAGKEYQLRDKAGTPGWAGKGRRKNSEG
jgi:hypothetical protein